MGESRVEDPGQGARGPLVLLINIMQHKHDAQAAQPAQFLVYVTDQDIKIVVKINTLFNNS